MSPPGYYLTRHRGALRKRLGAKAAYERACGISFPDAVISRHTLSYCCLCRTEMVVCGTCDNNCCNGTYGRRPENGLEEYCVDCPEAYVHQSAHLSGAVTVKFARDTRILRNKS